MSIIVGDVITAARGIWKESTSGDILTDSLCYGFLLAGAQEIVSARSDAAYDDEGDEVAFTLPTELTDSIPLDAAYQPVLTDYLIGRGFQANANLQNNKARATDHFQLFFSRVKTV